MCDMYSSSPFTISVTWDSTISISLSTIDNVLVAPNTSVCPGGTYNLLVSFIQLQGREAVQLRTSKTFLLFPTVLDSLIMSIVFSN
jgi:hypothetical protein